VNLRDGVQGVRRKFGEGKPWLVSNNNIIRDLNFAANSMASEAQLIRDTWASQTAINPAVEGGTTYYQEYQMPLNVEMPLNAKIKIGVMYPLNLDFQQSELQLYGFVASTPFAGYLRYGVNLTQQVPSANSGGGEIVMRLPGNKANVAEWILGFYPVPSATFQFWVDYVAKHPQMVAPMDICLIPDRKEFYDAWIAGAIASCYESMNDAANAATYNKIFQDGVQAFKEYQFKIQAFAQPPRYNPEMSSPRRLNPFTGVIAPTAANLTIQGG